MSKKMKRFILAGIVVIGLVIVAGFLLFPDAVSAIIRNPNDKLEGNTDSGISYVDASLCQNCHFEIDSIKKEGVHQKLNCQYCHGPAGEHILSPATNALVNPSEKSFCVKCHAKNELRSDEVIKQIDSSKHNASSECSKCHDAHSPTMKAATSDSENPDQQENVMACNTCHQDADKLKSAGKHKSIACQTCHGDGKDHVQAPSASNILNPTYRKFCGNCHSLENTAMAGKIKQIDMNEHNLEMNCIECHAAHNPPEFK